MKEKNFACNILPPWYEFFHLMFAHKQISYHCNHSVHLLQSLWQLRYRLFLELNQDEILYQIHRLFPRYLKEKEAWNFNPSQWILKKKQAYTYENGFFLISWKFNNTLTTGTFFSIVQWTKTSNNSNIAFISCHWTLFFSIMLNSIEYLKYQKKIIERKKYNSWWLK